MNLALVTVYYKTILHLYLKHLIKSLAVLHNMLKFSAVS